MANDIHRRRNQRDAKDSIHPDSKFKSTSAPPTHGRYRKHTIQPDPKTSAEHLMRRRKARRKARLFLFIMALVIIIVPVSIYSACRRLDENQSKSPSKFSEKNLYSVSDLDSAGKILPNGPLKGKVIFLDAGHGGTDNGCAYPQSDPLYLEKDYNLEITAAVQAELEKLGATVVLTRTDDSWISLYARAAMVHVYCIDYWIRSGNSTLSDEFLLRMREEMEATIQTNTDQIENNSMGPMVGSGFSEDMIQLLEAEYEMDDFLFLSIHNNWNSNTDLHGTQVYYVVDQSIIDSETRLISNDSYYQHPDYILRDPYYGRDGEKNAVLAQTMYDAITQAEPALITNTPQIVEDNFAVLREHGIPSVMLELTFVSNPGDRDLLDDPAVIASMSEGIADGCVNYFSS